MSGKPPRTHNSTTMHKEGWNVKESKLLPDTAPQGRVDLKPADFDKLIEQKGVRIKVFRSMYCPNVKSVDGAEHEIDCQLCNGSNFIDVDCIECKGFIQNQELERAMTEGGDIDGNTVLMTFPIGIELQYFTRVELKDFTEIYYQRVMRNPDSDTDILKFRACRVNVIIAKDNQQYFQQQDFNIDQNGNIVWGTRKPADNMIYSIHYETHMQFRAVKAMHVTRFTQYKSDQGVEHIKMCEQWMLAKEFLLRRNDINTHQPLNEGPFDNHENTTDNND